MGNVLTEDCQTVDFLSLAQSEFSEKIEVFKTQSDGNIQDKTQALTGKVTRISQYLGKLIQAGAMGKQNMVTMAGGSKLSEQCTL